MGDEVRCRVRFGDATSEGKALLETDELRFRGDFRLAVPLREIESVEAAEGELAVRFDGGEAVFELGPKAARWADRIRNPLTRLDKLGVKRDSVVSVVGLEDADFKTELEARVARYATDPAPESDLVLLGAESVADLERIAGLVPFLKPNGHIWVVAPKAVTTSGRSTSSRPAARPASRTRR